MSSSLLFAVLVTFVVAVYGQFQTHCNTTCEYADRVWVYRIKDEYVPTDLEDRNITFFSFDDTRDAWWQYCSVPNPPRQCPWLCDTCFINDCIDQTDTDANCPPVCYSSYCLDCNFYRCDLCKPEMVYLFTSQTRIETSTGRTDLSTYVDFAYTPTQDAWDATCTGNGRIYNYEIPALNGALDQTLVDEIYQSISNEASSYSCYNDQFCLFAHYAGPNSYEERCDSNTTSDGWPTDLFCGLEEYDIDIKFGCFGVNDFCDDFKFRCVTDGNCPFDLRVDAEESFGKTLSSLVSGRKNKISESAKRTTMMSRTQPFYSNNMDCLHEDVDWYYDDF